MSNRPTDTPPSPLSAFGQPRSGATDIVLDMARELRGGTIVLVLPNGEIVTIGHGAPVIHCYVHNDALFERVLDHGDIGFAESYLAGEWDCDRTADLLTLLASNREVLGRAVYGSFWRLLGHRLMHLLRSNTKSGSRRNIEAHYDLGNEFYREWLDPSMTYSSALFEAPDQPLEDAQRNKYRTLLREMGVQRGQHLLEIGCGWGGLAEVATTEFGCRVTGLTLSPSQLEWAKIRALNNGFADQVDFYLRDYRDERNVYDHIVSIEMIEAVGERFWPTYFSQLSRRLKPHGRIGIQAITIRDELFARYRRGTDFIQRYIFPGGMLPSPSEIARQAQRVGLEIKGKRNFGLDYARTLVLWREMFDAKVDHVLELGFDERFIRMWRFYFNYCEAGFRAGSTNVHHYVLGHSSAETA